MSWSVITHIQTNCIIPGLPKLKINNWDMTMSVMFEKYISMQKETHTGLGELMITDLSFEEQYSCLIDFNDVLQVDLWKPNSAYMIQENSPVDVHMGRNKTQWLRRRLRQAHIHYEWVSSSSLESYIKVNSSLVHLRVKHRFPGDTHLSSTRILQTLICMCRRIQKWKLDSE